MIARAPWTPANVAELNARQTDGVFHPYTCAVGCGPLVATADGWVCAGCGYRQDWAHDFPAVAGRNIGG